MKISLLKQFEQTHLQSMKEIKSYLSSNRKEMVAITAYLIKNEANPHSFLQKKWADNFTSSVNFLNLLQNIEQALYYTKEICFPVIDGQPKIILKNQNKFTIEDSINLNDENGESTEEHHIFFLNNIFDFIQEHSIYYIHTVKELFFHHAQIYGINEAKNAFNQNEYFDESWIDEYNYEYDN